MSAGMRRGRAIGPLDPTARYRETFLRDSHRWLAQGYAMLDAAGLSSAEEEEITGELVRAMNEIADRPDAPSCVLHMAVSEEVRQNTGGRRGKHRRRLDIEIMRTSQGRRPRFCIEAKRLHRSDSVSEYLGPDGLSCFLSGDYAPMAPLAGMLGYVQRDEPIHWAQKIEASLHADSRRYGLRKDGRWQAKEVVSSLADTYESRHDRATPGEPITIVHVLLRFH